MEYYYVYMLRCYNTKNALVKGIPKHGHIIYTGYTNNIIRRLQQHLNGHRFNPRRATYTERFNGNLRLMYLEVYDNKQEALDREEEIKKIGRDGRIKLVQKLSPEEIKIINNINLTVLRLVK